MFEIVKRLLIQSMLDVDGTPYFLRLCVTQKLIRKRLVIDKVWIERQRYPNLRIDPHLFSQVLLNIMSQ